MRKLTQTNVSFLRGFFFGGGRGPYYSGTYMKVNNKFVQPSAGTSKKTENTWPLFMNIWNDPHLAAVTHFLPNFHQINKINPNVFRFVASNSM